MNEDATQNAGSSPAERPVRPDCYEFAMGFIGAPQETEIRAYVAALERWAGAAVADDLDRLRADARRWQTIAPMFQGWSRRMDGTAHWVLHGGAIKPRARTVAEAVDAMAPNAGGKAPAAGAVD